MGGGWKSTHSQLRSCFSVSCQHSVFPLILIFSNLSREFTVDVFAFLYYLSHICSIPVNDHLSNTDISGCTSNPEGELRLL